jgi:predicted permease
MSNAHSRFGGNTVLILALKVVEIVAPVFLLAGLGFVWVKMGVEYRIRFVTQLAMTVSVPCLVFVALMQAEMTPEALQSVALAGLVSYGLVTIVIAAAVPLMGLNIRSYTSPLTFGNTGNIGLPLALFAFGDEGLSYAVIIFAIMAIWNFTYGVWLVSGGSSPLKVVQEPMVGATLLGGLFLWQGWQTPVFVTNTLELLGQMAIPLMLITLGVAVARLKPDRAVQASALSLLKLVICVGIAWGTGLYFDLNKAAFGVLVLQIATPVAVTSYLLAEKYGADANAVAGLVVASTLLSVLALPLLLAFLL